MSARWSALPFRPDRELVETAAGQTDSASQHAHDAGKDWNGDTSSAPDPTAC